MTPLFLRDTLLHVKFTMRHPNIVQVYDFDADGGLYYMVMEFIDGGALRTLLDTMQARDRVLASIKNIRDRFVPVTEVTWARSDDWIPVQSQPDIAATYTTSETWTFVGTVDRSRATSRPFAREQVGPIGQRRRRARFRCLRCHLAMAWA